MISHQNQRLIPLNLKSLRTRFAIRFLKALKKINHQEKIHNKINNTNNNGSSNNIMMMTHNNFHKIKTAADASMAAVVGPRRAWSRAVLSRIRLGWWRRGVVRKQRRGAVRGVMKSHQEGQTQELRRLVPGGEEMDMQNLLDETAHYIKCLTTQVNVMRSIVNHCSSPIN